MEALDDDILARIRELETEKSKWERIKTAALEEIKRCEQYIKDFNDKKNNLTTAANVFLPKSSDMKISDLSSSAIDNYYRMYDGCDTSSIESAAGILYAIQDSSNELVESLKSDIQSFCEKIISREEKNKEKQEIIVKDCDEYIKIIEQEIANIRGY